MKSENAILYIGLAAIFLGLIWLAFQLYKQNRLKKKIERLEAERNVVYKHDIEVLISQVFK